MRFVPTSAHGLIDYAVGLFLIALPAVMGLHGVEQGTLSLLGALAIAYSLFTDYELGVVHLFPMRVHLVFDAIFGTLLIVCAAADVSSDYLARTIALIIGICAIILSSITRYRPSNSRLATHL